MGDHACVHILGATLEAPDVVVDEALGRVELGTSLAVDIEDVRALDRRTTRGIGGFAKRYLVGQLGAIEASNVAKLANSRL